MCVCNGELYLFRPLKAELAREYEFKSGSDCEIILPLYRKYGLEMFKKLDAEFAMLIYDAQKDQLIAARDPIGIRPLFYGKMSDGSMMGSIREKSQSMPSSSISSRRAAAALFSPARLWPPADTSHFPPYSCFFGERSWIRSRPAESKMKTCC